MEVHYEDEAKVPAPPKKVTSNIKRFVEILESIPQGKVAVVKPGPDQSVRGMKTSFGRIASARDMEVVTWSEEGGNELYVKRLK